MNLSDFDYYLPKELIAQTQAHPRDCSRLLVLNKVSGELKHAHFFDLTDFLKPGDVLVVNNTKVFPARIWGEREDSGGKVQIFLHKEITPGQWEVMGKNLKVGKIIKFKNSILRANIESKNSEYAEVKFNLHGKEFFKEIEKIGTTPLPPYIKRNQNEMGVFNDRETYQTVYAKERGSVAAPTAGLHFTDDLLEKLRVLGVEILEVTLHVGFGTFKPIDADNFQNHKMHSEAYSVDLNIYDAIIKYKKEGRRIISVGTTTARVLEHIFKEGSSQLTGQTDIFIYPGYTFKCIDGLITNFHLPKSSLLLLVSALAGRKFILHAYAEAVKNKYRFYSYGDAMLIV